MFMDWVKVLRFIKILIFVKMNPQKKLKLILASLKDKEIIKFFQVFCAHFPNHLKKTIRQISFNCYQSVCEFKTKIVSGYGKNSNEAYINSVRTLVQLLADDSKIHSVLKQSLRLIQQPTQNQANFDSQKKLIHNDKGSRNSLKTTSLATSLHSSVKPGEKKSTLKEEIFEYLNLQNLKISNPNATHKTKNHDKYMSQSGDEDQQALLDELNRKNEQLERQLHSAKEENVVLKKQLKYQNSQQQNMQQHENQENTKSKGYIRQIVQNKAENAQQPLKQRTNQFLNMSQDSKLLQKSKMRSISVEANQIQAQTQKYMIPKASNQKKILIPKLNLQVLPNYHGKSNKSLNQSLMDVYEKSQNK